MIIARKTIPAILAVAGLTAAKTPSVVTLRNIDTAGVLAKFDVQCNLTAGFEKNGKSHLLRTRIRSKQLRFTLATKKPGVMLICEMTASQGAELLEYKVDGHVVDEPQLRKRVAELRPATAVLRNYKISITGPSPPPPASATNIDQLIQQLIRYACIWPSDPVRTGQSWKRRINLPALSGIYQFKLEQLGQGRWGDYATLRVDFVGQLAAGPAEHYRLKGVHITWNHLLEKHVPCEINAIAKYEQTAPLRKTVTQTISSKLIEYRTLKFEQASQLAEQLQQIGRISDSIDAKQWETAKTQIHEFMQKYPDSLWLPQVEFLERYVNKHPGRKDENND